MPSDDSTFYPLAVAFDSSLDRAIDQVLSLGLWHGLKARGDLSLLTSTLSRHDLQTAAFFDLVARFYAAGKEIEGADTTVQGIVGMPTEAAPSALPAMLKVALSKRTASGEIVYPRRIVRVTDTADPATLLRNGLYVEGDQGCSIALVGAPYNLLSLLALEGARELVARKVLKLTVAAGRFVDGPPDPLVVENINAFRRLLELWPSPIVFAGAEIGEAVPYPAASIQTDYTWTPDHPIVDAYRATTVTNSEAPASSMAAVLHAADRKTGYFPVSPSGTIRIGDDGTMELAPGQAGRHAHLLAPRDDVKRIVDIYTKATSFNVTAPVDAKPLQAALRSSERGVARMNLTLLAAVLFGIALFSLPVRTAGQAPQDFDTAVKPVLTSTCAQCHNARLNTGGLDVSRLMSKGSVRADRKIWERMLVRMRAGEMPPVNSPKPAAEKLQAMVSFLEGEFQKADASKQPDPGRVTMRRLNRTEYSNTIRDLLGVSFRAEKHLPADDSGAGFDNLADILTVSPVLMERYFDAAELITAWVLGTETPKAPLSAVYDLREKNLLVLGPTAYRFEHTIEYAGEYTVRFGMPGTRASAPDPVTLGLWMDGSLLKTIEVAMQPDKTVYFDPYSEREMRLHLPAGDHLFQAAFINDKYARALDKDLLYWADDRNKFIRLVTVIGPYPSSIQNGARASILACDLREGRPCLKKTLQVLGRRAYRRTMSGAEIDRLIHVADLATAAGGPPEAGLRAALQAILVSPNFLFRIEPEDPANPDTVHPVSDFELASRLSYFLWSSMPDDQLLDVAEAGRLRQPGILHGQVERMLRDPKAERLAANFAGQWLETRNLDAANPDSNKFPKFTAEIGQAMKTESILLFDHILRENRPITEFLDAAYSFLNEPLAEYYEIDGIKGEEFRRVDLTTPASRLQRGGVLGLGGVLTVSSYPNRTSPVLRGKYILQNILGAPPPPPPANVPTLDAARVGVDRSMREQLEIHRRNPDCAVCHNRMDPLGFGLENYDAAGKWRVADGKFPVDASGMLPDGRTFSNPEEMRKLLMSELPRFSRNLTEKMMTYALGRGLESYDRPTVESLQRRLESNGNRFQTLVYGIVESLPFQSRRGEQGSRNQP